MTSFRAPRFDVSRARELYEDGMSLAQVAEVVGVAQSTVSVQLRRAGVPMRRASRPRVAVSDEKIVRLRDGGATWAQVAAEVGLSVAGARTRYLATQGLHRRAGEPFVGSTRRPRPERPPRAPKATDEQLLMVKSWGATHREAAAMLGLTPAAVASRLHRLRRRSAA